MTLLRPPRFLGVPIASLLLLAGGSIAIAQGTNAVTVDRKPQQQMTYGMDFERLWSWGPNKVCPTGLREKQRLMELAVRDCQVDYVRVAVNGAAELTEGTFDERAYDDILEVMTLCKAARPDIKFFASPRPINEAIKGAPWGMFPPWIAVDESWVDAKGAKRWRKLPFEPEKAGDYMVRYLRFMKSKGFDISFLDLKNESCERVRPAAAAIMAKRIREQMGPDAPLLLAPSSFDYMVGGDWVTEAARWPGTGFFDILSTHNTRGTESGDLGEFVTRGRKLKKPVWNTELHGWRGNDTAAVSNTVILLDQIRAGVSGISDWLSLGNEKKDYKMFRTMNDGSLEVMRIYYIFKQIVNTSGGAHYFPSSIPAGLTSTVAFVRDNVMTIWLLNGTDTPAPGVQIDLGTRTILDDTVKTVWWDPANGREGSVGEAKPSMKNAITVDVGAQTLICFEFKVK